MTWLTPPSSLGAAADVLGLALLHSVWQGAAIALAYVLVRALVPASNAVVRYRLAALSMALLVVLPVVTVLTRGSNTSAPRADLAATVAQVSPAAIPATTSAATVAGLPNSALAPWLPLATLTWLLGVVALSSCYAVGLYRTRGLRREALPLATPAWEGALERLRLRLDVRRPVLLLESARAQVPTVIGWLRPAIVVPTAALSGLSPAQVEAILAHELAHVRRSDFLANVLQAAVEILVFYHPATWWLSREVRREREHCCDDLAVLACGDRATYARALARVAEVAAGLRPAFGVAADGEGKPMELLARLRRLYAAPQPRYGRTAIAVLLALGTAGLAAARMLGDSGWNEEAAADHGSSFETQSLVRQSRLPPIPRPSIPHPGNNLADGTGRWHGSVVGEHADIDVRWGHDDRRNASSGWRLRLAELGDNRTQVLRLRRDAGTLVFEGGFPDGRDGSGALRFEPSASFRAELAKIGWQVPAERQIEAALFDIKLSWASDLAKLGYGPAKLDLDELFGWAIHDVDPAWIRALAAAGHRDIPADTLLAMKIHDVTPAFLADLARDGFADLNLDQAIAFSIHGVSGQVVKDIQAAGFAKPSADDVLAWQIHDVSAASVASLRARGFEIETLDDAVALTIHGIDEAFVAEMKALDLGNLETEDLLALRIHGVTASDLADIKDAGFADPTVDDVLAWKIHGIQAESLAAMRKLGLEIGSLDDALAYSIHNIDADFITSMKSLELGPLDGDQLVALRIHDIDAALVRSLRAEGIEGLDADAVVALAIHNVDASTVQALRERGFTNINADDLVDYAIHGRRWERPAR